MNYLRTLMLTALFFGPFSNAQEVEIGVPDGWVATGTGIAKGNSELSIGPVLELGELSPASYLSKLAEVPIEGMIITDVAELKDGDIVVQVMREVIQGASKARSILFVCKGGQNKHRLLELFTDDVFAVISGGKAAIGFCSQS